MIDEFIIEERETDTAFLQLVKLDPREKNRYAVMSGRSAARITSAKGFKSLEDAVWAFHRMTKKGETDEQA